MAKVKVKAKQRFVLELSPKEASYLTILLGELVGDELYEAFEALDDVCYLFPEMDHEVRWSKSKGIRFKKVKI